MKKFIIISLLISCVYVRSMELDPGYLADGSQEVPEQVNLRLNPVPALRNLGIAAIARQLPALFKNSHQAQRLAFLPEELRQELWHRHMFGSNDRVAERHPSILWLLSKCPVSQWRERYQDTVFATDLRNYGNLCAQVKQNMCLEVVDSRTKEKLLECISEDPLACVQFSVDGKFLYLINRGGRIEVLNTDDWQAVHQANLQSRTRSLRYIILTPSNAAVVCGGVNTLIVHDTLTGAPLCNLVRGSQEMIMQVNLSQDGNDVFVFYEDAVHIPDENMPALLNAFNAVDMQVQRFNISAVNAMLLELPRLSLEQLLVLQVVSEIVGKREPLDLIADPHIRAAYDALPDSMREAIERAVPALKNYIPGFDTPMLGSESAQKRRKVALEPINSDE